MKRFLLCLSFFFLTLLSSPQYLFAQELQPERAFFTGKVMKVLGEKKTPGVTSVQQSVSVSFKDGREQIQTLTYSFQDANRRTQKLQVGDSVVVAKTQSSNEQPVYSIYDRYRLTWLYAVMALFVLLILLMTQRRGIGAILGLGISFAVIIFFIVPQILAGQDPLFITILGSLFIMVTTIYLAHGFSQRTTIAIASTFLSLVITGVLSVLMVTLLRLSGTGSEDAMLLQFGQQTLNLQGLLLAGIIIGTLGVLDDTTTTQAATVFELAQANTKLPVRELLKRGFRVGREHITSLVNTLVLAYAGASLPLFIFFVLNPMQQPAWTILNNEMIVEEVVRTFAGSIGLILAVPITTLLAAFFSRYSIKVN